MLLVLLTAGEPTLRSLARPLFRLRGRALLRLRHHWFLPLWRLVFHPMLQAATLRTTPSVTALKGGHSVTFPAIAPVGDGIDPCSGTELPFTASLSAESLNNSPNATAFTNPTGLLDHRAAVTGIRAAPMSNYSISYASMADSPNVPATSTPHLSPS